MKNLFYLFVFVLLNVNLYSQTKEEYPDGHIFGKLFFDAYSEVGAGNNISAMEIRRVYFGYKYNYDKHYQFYIKLDIGSPTDLSPTSTIRRYAFFKNAGLKYHKDKLTVNMGITDVYMFTTQEKYWGHRYINKMYLDRFHFGPKADIGANVRWDFSDRFSMDFGLYNGEGYKYLQKDNTYRGGLGITYYPFKSLITRVYLDYAEKAVSRATGSFFIGYKYKKKAIFGFEYNYQKNHTFLKDHDLFGFSTYLTWNFNDKWSAFGRYDLVKSNETGQTNNAWNLIKDGKAATYGFQYVVRKGIVVAIDYQDWYSDLVNTYAKKMIVLNLEAKF